MKNIILTILQIFLVIVWVVSSSFFKADFNLFVFNFLPIPNFGLVTLTIFLVLIGYWLQGLKKKK